MIIGTLDGWRPEPGDLVEWLCRTEESARAAAIEQSVGPSFLQRDHLMSAVAKRASGEPHRAVIAAVTTVDEPLDREAMTLALNGFLSTHDELRCFFAVTPDGAATRYLAPPDSIEMESVDVGPAPDRHSLDAHLYARIESDATFDRLPGLAAGAIDAGTSFGFYLISDHSHSDGMSIITALDEVFTRYRAHRAGSTPELPAARSHIDHIAHDFALAAEATDADERVGVWRTILAEHDRSVPRSPLDLGLSGSETAPAAAYMAPLLDADETQHCLDRSKSDGSSLTGAIFAALAAAEVEQTGETDYFTSTVLSTRGPDQLGTQGWLCNFAPIAFSVDDTDDEWFARLVAVAGDAVRLARHLNTVPVHGVMATLAASGEFVPESGSPQMVSYLDLRRLADASAPEIHNGIAVPVLGRTRNANVWVNRNDDGLAMLCHHPDNPTARTSVQRLAERVAAILATYSDGAVVGRLRHGQKVGSR